MSPRPHHGKHIQYQGEERERSLQQIGERLKKIGELIATQGHFKINESEVKPPDPCLFIVRYERLPRGELSLKIELMWDEDTPAEVPGYNNEVVIS